MRATLVQTLSSAAVRAQVVALCGTVAHGLPVDRNCVERAERAADVVTTALEVLITELEYRLVPLHGRSAA